MQLNAVVLPAPFGPISPTISHSSTLRFRLSMAVRPPKRMVRSRTSSTDIAALHRAYACAAVRVVQRELVAGEPAGERTDDLTEPPGVEDHSLEKQYRADDVGDVELVVAVERAPAGLPGEPLHERVDQGEE